MAIVQEMLEKIGPSKTFDKAQEVARDYAYKLRSRVK